MVAMLGLRPDEEARVHAAAQNADPVVGLTHGFYRYPARFAPAFARTLIEVCTTVGDLVLDPFVGGGTTLVESFVLGRDAVGLDISALAHFISSAKTTLYSPSDLAAVDEWVSEVSAHLRADSSARPSPDDGRLRNLSLPHTWRTRQLLHNALVELCRLPSKKQRLLARCIILRAGQWALDCRREMVSVAIFRQGFRTIGKEMVEAASSFRSHALSSGGSQVPTVRCFHRSATGCEKDRRVRNSGAPQLILTSPPYPGVHVVYHRWQILGRRETAAPFWVADVQDGDGASHYTFGDRRERSLDRYFESAKAAFRSLASVAGPETIMAQMVGFADAKRHLPRYLEMLSGVGFSEVLLSTSPSSDGRVWRTVPNRKWYSDTRGATPASSEVVLFHRLT